MFIDVICVRSDHTGPTLSADSSNRSLSYNPSWCIQKTPGVTEWLQANIDVSISWVPHPERRGSCWTQHHISVQLNDVDDDVSLHLTDWSESERFLVFQFVGDRGYAHQALPVHCTWLLSVHQLAPSACSLHRHPTTTNDISS